MNSTLGEALEWATQCLKTAGIESARLDARVLLEFATGLSRADMIGHPEKPLAQAQKAAFRSYVSRRERGEPVSRVVGERSFWGLTLKLNAHTLDPRPDSEALIGALIEARPDGQAGASLQILDLGTGSGCLLLALLSEWPNAQGLGVDQSAEALQQADTNAMANGLAARSRWLESDWTADVDASFDVVVSNPPYIRSDRLKDLMPEVRDHDPKAALDGGADGLDFYRRTAATIDDLLLDSGVAALEVGVGQAADVTKLFENKGFSTSTVNDLAGIARCVLVRRLEEQ